MGLSQTLTRCVEISKNGDLFHDLFRHIPQDLAAIVPNKIHDCELHEGKRGAVGSVICWRYTHEGKKKIAKEIIESVSEENQTVVFRVIEGDLVEVYKSFAITFHVEPKGDREMVVWTLDFERSDTSVPYPTSFMNYLCDLVNDMDTRT